MREPTQLEQAQLEAPTMTFQERLRLIEERYDVSESEYARELGRTVADLQD
jgi:DNA-binding transcriptional regulator YiaG